MEKEVSNSSLLGLIILGLCGLGVIGGIIYYIVTTFFIQEGGLKLTLPQIFFFLVAVCGIAEYFFIKSNNDKLNIWDNSGYEYEDNLVALADVDYYESSFQIRTPKKVSYLKALRCKLGDISEKKTLKFGNDTVVDIEFGNNNKLPITTYTEEDLIIAKEKTASLMWIWTVMMVAECFVVIGLYIRKILKM